MYITQGLKYVPILGLHQQLATLEVLSSVLCVKFMNDNNNFMLYMIKLLVKP